MGNILLMDLLFPAARQRVLAVLLLQPQSAFHLRELAREGLIQRAARRTAAGAAA